MQEIPITEYLNNIGVKWEPVNLKNGKVSSIGEYRPDMEDYKLDKLILQERQKQPSEFIVIFTDVVQIYNVKIRNFELDEQVPYFKSISDDNPQYLITCSFDRTPAHGEKKYDVKAGTIYNGIWAFARRDSKIYNAEKNKTFELSDFGSRLKPSLFKKLCKKFKEKIEELTQVELFTALYNIFNIACEMCIKDPYNIVHNLMNGNKLYNDDMVVTIDSMVYSKGCSKYTETIKILREQDNVNEDVNEEELCDITHHGVAEYIFNKYTGKIINNQGIFYVYFKNEWIEDLHHVFKCWLSESNFNICSDPKKNPSYVRDQTNQWPHYITHLLCMCEKLEIVDVLDKQTGILPFIDGYYNMSSKVFTNYSDETVCYFTYKVKRKFPTNSSKIKEVTRILLDIFNEDKISLEEVLCFWSRCIGKHTTDKFALLLVGARNSSKGLMIGALECAFKGIVGNILSGDLISKKGSFESAERKNGCLAPMCNNLICFSQEVNPKSPFDGTMWRTMVSGGDLTSYRTAYGKLTEKPIRAGLTITANSIITFDISKSSETLLVYNMPCKFVDELPEDEIDRGYTLKKADTSVKDIFITPEYLDAFTIIILESYITVKPSYVNLRENSRLINEVEEDDLDSGDALGNAINKFYTINTIGNNDIKVTNVHKTIKIRLDSATPAQVLQFLANKGVKNIKIRGTHYYRGLIEKS